MLGNQFHKGLRIMSHCPLCESRYRSFEAMVLDERGDAHLIYIQCRSCNGSVIALVCFDEGGVNSVGMVTELTKEEVMKYGEAEAVGADDVIDAYQFFTEIQKHAPYRSGASDKGSKLPAGKSRQVVTP